MDFQFKESVSARVMQASADAAILLALLAIAALAMIAAVIAAPIILLAYAFFRAVGPSRAAGGWRIARAL